jgi:hypothetical protein
MVSPTYTDTAETPDPDPNSEGGLRAEWDVIEVVNSIFYERDLESPLDPGGNDPVSDEADDLVAALEASERLAHKNEVISLEDSMRAHGVDPADFGLSGS